MIDKGELFSSVVILMMFLTLSGIVLFMDPDFETIEADMYTLHLNITIYEFDTKAQALEAERIIDDELGGCAGLLDPKGPFWDRRWPVEILGPHYWDKPKNYFKWDDPQGQELIHKIKRKN